jgi:hypothetical protein
MARRTPRLAVGTVVARNFLPFARVLARSIREHQGNLPILVALADGNDDMIGEAEPFEVIALHALGISDLRRLCFRYTRQQLTVACKPYLLRNLLARGFDCAVFLDADILVTGSLDRLFREVGEHAISLAPHLLAPLACSQRASRELNILQSGVYNGGFIAVSNS